MYCSHFVKYSKNAFLKEPLGLYVFKLWGKLGENEVIIEEISEKIDEDEDLEFSKNYFLIRGRSWIETAAYWPNNIFWLEAAAINGAATVVILILS